LDVGLKYFYNLMIFKNLLLYYFKRFFLPFFWLVVTLILSSRVLYSQNFSETELKAAYLFQFAQNISWPESSNKNTFEFCIYSTNEKILADFKKFATNKTVNGKPISLVTITTIDESKSISPMVLFVSSEFQNIIPDLRQQTTGKPILLVTDNYTNDNLSMVNFGYFDSQKKLISYKINSDLIKENGMVPSPKLQLLSGNRATLNELIVTKELELQDEKEKAEKYKAQLEQQKAQLVQQEQTLQLQKEQVAIQQLDINKQKLAIETQGEMLETLRRLIDSNNVVYRKKVGLLTVKEQELENVKQSIAEQQFKIKAQEDDIDRRNKLLSKLNSDISVQQERIQEQKSDLYQMAKQVKQQKSWLYLFALAVALGFATILFFVHALQTKKRAGKVLEEKNEAIEQKGRLIEQQKEEILTQSEMLERTNRELEKLSIVASETDNSVIIMDSHGNFDWVNPGFTRMTGYSLEDLRKTKGQNIQATSTNPKIEQILDYCIKNKKAVIYDSFFQKYDSEIVWLQTTLTPIVKANGKVEKLVAIDSNITRLKEIENELNHTNEELTAQRDELTIQKGRIERQNRHITESIQYAQTIQTAILPLKDEISKLYESFIVYKPKDIVSGDFYWFAPLPDKDGLTSRTLIAVADCTGHGVPGAMMSMVGSRLLNEIVHEKGITEPHNILSQLDISFRKALKQEKRNSIDGMEVCLCLLEKSENQTTVSYSGAKLSLYHYCLADDSIFRIKGTPREIGGFLYQCEEKNFVLNTIDLSAGDCLYLCSDGFADQAGKDNLRYGKQRLLSLLKSIAPKPFAQQQELLENSLSAWQQDIRQRDDITVMGLRVS
jgi:PAS domain S-box-containing protein